MIGQKKRPLIGMLTHHNLIITAHHGATFESVEKAIV
jgi:hypothetical protein